MKLYSIGEVSKINNIPIKTLRYYDEIGLLKPIHINPENGYRYYGYSQFATIDKIKRFKNWDISLRDLKKILIDKDKEVLSSFLMKQDAFLEEEALRIERLKIELKRFKRYINYTEIIDVNKGIYGRTISERFYIAVSSKSNETNADIMEMDMDLRKTIRSKEFTTITELNPYGYILDPSKLLKGKIDILKSTVGVGYIPETNNDVFYKIPSGNFICFACKLLSNTCDIQILSDYLKDHDIEPKLIMAEEYSPITIHDYENSTYEIQVLI